MGCRKLNITSYYRLAGATGKPHSRPRQPAQKITRIAGFFTVIPNYRYYSPELGRWTKRDKIGEEGGVNVYVFVTNNGADNWDSLGNGITYNIDIVPINQIRKGYLAITYNTMPLVATSEFCSDFSSLKVSTF